MHTKKWAPLGTLTASHSEALGLNVPFPSLFHRKTQQWPLSIGLQRTDCILTVVIVVLLLSFSHIFFALSISLPSVTSGKTADCIAIVKSKRSCSSLRLFYSSIVSALISPHLVLCWFFLLLLFFSLCFCSLPPFSHNSLWLFEFLNASKIDRERLCSLSSFSLFLFPVAPFPLSSLFPFALSLSLSVSLFFLN